MLLGYWRCASLAKEDRYANYQVGLTAVLLLAVFFEIQEVESRSIYPFERRPDFGYDRQPYYQYQPYQQNYYPCLYPWSNGRRNGFGGDRNRNFYWPCYYIPYYEFEDLEIDVVAPSARPTGLQPNIPTQILPLNQGTSSPNQTTDVSPDTRQDDTTLTQDESTDDSVQFATSDNSLPVVTSDVSVSDTTPDNSITNLATDDSI
ncbi:hypothetical protein CHUAL_009902 [Chamberlinius hualienensis]